VGELRRRDDGDMCDRPTDRVVRPKPPAQAIIETADMVRRAKGIWRDEVFRRRPDGGVEKVEDTGWSGNRIVATFTKLLAGLLANEPTFNGGILFSAQGRGDPSFDTVLPTPEFSAVKLRDEYFRKTPDSISFVDDDGNPAAEVTGAILIRTTLDFDEANGAGSGEFIREQGLYGGPAEAVTDSGLLVNLIYHKARFKDASVKIIRSIRLIL